MPTGTVAAVETVMAADDDARRAAHAVSPSAWSRIVATWLAPASPVPTWIGIVVVAAGFGIIAYGWSRVAGLLSVPLQMPYMISAGFTGLGLVCLGIGIVAVQAKRQETAARQRHLDEIRDLVERLDRHVTGSQGFGPERDERR